MQCIDAINFHFVVQGDIKCENVLITSTNWVYLADFASFKPTYIPYDDPSDFSFFFDTGGRRLCYLAPEVCSLSFLYVYFICFVVFLISNVTNFLSFFLSFIFCLGLWYVRDFMNMEGRCRWHKIPP